MYLETENIPYRPGSSFASIRYVGGKIHCPYHQHTEVELAWLGGCQGRVVAGSYAGTFRSGDIFLLGSHVPHIFQNPSERFRGRVRTHVIQFREDFCGQSLWDLVEMRRVRKLFGTARRGLKLNGKLRKIVPERMAAVHEAEGAKRVLALLELLVLLAESRSLEPLSSETYDPESQEADGRMSRVMAYIQENLASRLSVPEAASQAGLTPNAFCRYFRQQTHRTFTDVVNELRIGEACRLLTDTKLSVTEIAFAAGFSNLSHFYSEFRQRLKTSPRTYRLKSML